MVQEARQRKTDHTAHRDIKQRQSRKQKISNYCFFVCNSCALSSQPLSFTSDGRSFSFFFCLITSLGYSIQHLLAIKSRLRKQTETFCRQINTDVLDRSESLTAISIVIAQAAQVMPESLYSFFSLINVSFRDRNDTDLVGSRI